MPPNPHGSCNARHVQRLTRMLDMCREFSRMKRMMMRSMELLPLLVAITDLTSGLHTKFLSDVEGYEGGPLTPHAQGLHNAKRELGRNFFKVNNFRPVFTMQSQFDVIGKFGHEEYMTRTTVCPAKKSCSSCDFWKRHNIPCEHAEAASLCLRDYAIKKFGLNQDVEYKKWLDAAVGENYFRTNILHAETGCADVHLSNPPPSLGKPMQYAVRKTSKPKNKRYLGASESAFTMHGHRKKAKRAPPRAAQNKEATTAQDLIVNTAPGNCIVAKYNGGNASKTTFRGGTKVSPEKWRPLQILQVCPRVSMCAWPLEVLTCVVNM